MFSLSFYRRTVSSVQQFRFFLHYLCLNSNVLFKSIELGAFKERFNFNFILLQFVFVVTQNEVCSVTLTLSVPGVNVKAKQIGEIPNF